ncbi:hypothetical protein EDB85DRAFT_119403 [Lactarius pseudohatsudake]|nr:hypothetical protein EDB85DRAFT_119403 [Lactarius pseudohatsudake]
MFHLSSECELYLRFARAIGLLPPTDRFTRAMTEDSALDSSRNGLFSVACFRELAGAYPARITVVGHDFKRRRFEQLHRRALRWPKLHFTYVGIPLGTEADERQAVSGETNAFTPYSTDLYGCHAPTQRPTGTTLVRQKCASCWSGVRGMPRESSWCASMGEGLDILSYGRPFPKWHATNAHRLRIRWDIVIGPPSRS